MRILSVIYILAITLSGCKHFAKSTQANPECKSIISGEVISQGKWFKKLPALVTKKKNKEEIIRGRIIEKKADGYIFKPYRTQTYGPDPEPALYHFDEIICLIDSNGHTVYGTPPDEYLRWWGMTIEVVPVTNIKAGSTFIELNPNKVFSFCLEPGSYLIKKITFNFTESGFLGDKYTDISETLPNITFKVDEGKDNYIGEIYIDDEPNIEKSSKILCIAGERPTDAVGMQFGLLGALASASAKSKLNPFHYIFFKNEKYDEKKPNNVKSSINVSE